MNLKELIYKKLKSTSKLTELCAKYDEHPAIFDTEAPADTQKGWDGKSQYPRITYICDMQANEERASMGTLSIMVYTERTSMVILELEALVKECFRDIIMNPDEGGPYCFAWARTEPFLLEGNNVMGEAIDFDLMEYCPQETTDPDPIMPLGKYIKELYPEIMVIGMDKLPEMLDTVEKPIVYCRIQTLNKVSGHNMNMVSWMDCRMAVHLLYPNKEKNIKILAALAQKMSLDERIIMLDGSPMSIAEVQIDRQADYLKAGQLYITGRYGVLKYKAKQQEITKNVINNKEG